MAELQPFGALSFGAPPFAELLERVRPEVDRALVESWECARHEHAALGPAVLSSLEAARELCLRGGKRLRAALVAAGHYIAGGGPDLGVCMPICCAVELLHAYFLIHDDWMDQDELRRGGPAVHTLLARKFSSAHLGAAGAVLAGDYTLALATRALTHAALPSDRRADVLRRFVAMQLDAVVGQQLDVLGNGSNLDDVYRLKTGSYTVLGPLELGAALHGSPPGLSAALEAFALPLGIAFQLRDDLIGAFGDPTQTGKRTLLLQAALEDTRASQLLGAVLGRRDAPASAVDAALAAIDAAGARAGVEARIGELSTRCRAALAAEAFAPPARRLLEGVLSALIDRVV
jgi:geranylgeranyl diphosphate synthase, type I